MLTQVFNSIKAGIDVKSNLLIFKEKLKEYIADDSQLDDIKEEYQVFTGLLHDVDPKIRKNAAAILGQLRINEAVEAIFEAYLTDETNYNKGNYLKSIGMLDYSSINDRLLCQWKELVSAEVSPENRKHRIEELHELGTLLLPVFGSHEFTGSTLINEFVLLTNRNFKKVTMDELGSIPHKEFTAGVMVKTKQLDFVLNSIRTYSELLFVPEGCRMVSSDPVTAASELNKTDIVKYVSERVSNSDSPIAFRIDYRTKDIKRKADFEHKLANELECASGWRLINSTGNYELEFRFIDSSDNRLIVLVRFCMLRDKRFAYRQEALSVSIKPYLAALMMHLASDYLKDNASVCDPFCGSGAMLVERDRFKPVRIMYGIDIFKEAVKACEINIRAAGLKSKTELITRDFFDFKHEYKFDEIFTDMPFVSNQKSKNDIELIYKNFFKKLTSVMEPHGYVFIHTRNRDFLRKYALTGATSIIAEYELSKVEGSYFFILQMNN